MHDWLHHRARATPETTALVDADETSSWSYSSLDRAVEEAAGRLCTLGVEPGDHVALLLPTNAAAAGLFHAGMRLGVVLVPLDDRLTAPEIETRLARADVTLLICSADSEQTAIEAAGDVPVATIDDPQWEEVHPLPGTEESPIDRHEWSLDDPLLILSTSGTTGEPKLVTLTVGNVLWSAIASGFRLGIDPDDIWLDTLSFGHMGGIAPIYRSALYGTTLVLKSSFDPGATADAIDEYDATGISLVPTMLVRMLESRGTLADSLRVVLLGGAPASPELIDRCRNFSIPVYPTYGMTETASQIATARPKDAFEVPDSVGRPLMWVDVTIIDEDGTPLEPGERGEIVVDGPIVSPRYYDAPETTAAAHCAYGLRTGDVGYFDESGRLYVLNRLDDRITTGGKSVDPGEVGDVLTDHSGVTDASVVGIPDSEWGERVAALVVRSDEELTGETLQSFARERLAGFKCPRFVLFAEELPRTVSGTVDRERVQDRLVAFADRVRETHGIPDAESDGVLVPEELLVGDERELQSDGDRSEESAETTDEAESDSQ